MSQSAQQAEHNLKQIEALDSQRAVLLPDQYELKEAVSMYKKKQEEYMKRYSVGKEQILSDIRKYQNELSTLTDNLVSSFLLIYISICIYIFLGSFFSLKYMHVCMYVRCW